MTIRIRLLIMLLGTALVPLIVTSLSHLITIHVARHRLSQNARTRLDTMAQETLLEELGSYVDVLMRERQLARALIERQAREIEWALTQPLPTPTTPIQKDDFGYDPTLTLSTEQYHPCFQDINDPNIDALEIDYQRQTYTFLPWADPKKFSDVLPTLASLTKVYHDIYQQAPDGTLWLTTRFNDGLITRYPSTRSQVNIRPTDSPGRNNERRPPAKSNNRRRGTGRFRRPDNRERTRPSPLLIDPITHQLTVMFDVPIHDLQGEQIGSTAFIRTVPEIFSSLSLPELWGENIERMLIRVDPNEPERSSAQIVLHDAQKITVQQSRRRFNPGRINSPDSQAFQAMVADITLAEPGVRTMTYKDQNYVWAYYPLDLQDVAALLLVPSNQVTILAQHMERSLFQGSLIVLEISGVVSLIVIIVAIILAIRKARQITQPIESLITAGRQLAMGDYETKVQITTGDELEQFGDVFNQVGPQLREREKMKNALELARAVQQSLLPKQTPALDNFDIAGQCIFCDETGGDCYDFIDLSDITPDKHGIVLGDVSGHGIGAALLMAAIRGSLQSEAKHHSHDLSELMTELNRQIVRDTEVDRFVTLFYGILDGPSRSLIWAAAGHEPALWYHHADQNIEELPNTGMPIGVIDAAEYEQAGPIILAPHDILIIGTDGIREAQNQQGEEFGRERLHTLVQKSAHQNAEKISQIIIREVLDFLGTAPRTDDITLVVIKSNES